MCVSCRRLRLGSISIPFSDGGFDVLHFPNPQQLPLKEKRKLTDKQRFEPSRSGASFC